MTDGTRRVLATVLAFVGLAWVVGVDVWRGRSREHSARVFWLHLTAPLVAIVLTLLALWLLINTDRVRRAGGHALQHPLPGGTLPGKLGTALVGPVLPTGRGIVESLQEFRVPALARQIVPDVPRVLGCRIGVVACSYRDGARPLRLV